MFTIGRNNLSITVHVPHACQNDCKFCNVKEIYKDGVNWLELHKSCRTLAKTTVKEVVISGGEPMNDLQGLCTLLEVFTDKTVYINTCLIQEKFYEFVDLVNSYPNVRGVNVSRHGNSFEDDKASLSDIVPDEEVQQIKKPVRINVVMTDTTDTEKIIERWSKYEFTINFRQDYTKTTADTLYTLDGIPAAILAYQLTNINRCRVCQTVTFNTGNKEILFHKGLESTSAQDGESIEVNDIIVFPDGVIAYDWSKEKVLDDLKFIAPLMIPIPAYPTYRTFPYSACCCESNTRASCGGGGGCGSGGCGRSVSLGGCGSGGC